MGARRLSPPRRSCVPTRWLHKPGVRSKHVPLDASIRGSVPSKLGRKQQIQTQGSDKQRNAIINIGDGVGASTTHLGIAT
jgi:hypothetical protein